MSEAIRYKGMTVGTDSDCVLAADYDALKEERDQLRAELGEVKDSMAYRTSLIGRTEKERNYLRAELAELRKNFDELQFEF